MFQSGCVAAYFLSDPHKSIQLHARYLAYFFFCFVLPGSSAFDKKVDSNVLSDLRGPGIADAENAAFGNFPALMETLDSCPAATTPSCSTEELWLQSKLHPDPPGILLLDVLSALSQI